MNNNSDKSLKNPKIISIFDRTSPSNVTIKTPDSKSSPVPLDDDIENSTASDDNIIKNIIKFFSTSPTEIIPSDQVNPSFDRKTAHKVIDGVKYSSLKELKKNRLKCLFETCEISWNNAEWVDR
tara:strand:+ start:834 stop:1205 length:372 start_codon:yes stop_codon:yes gene_type:complete